MKLLKILVAATLLALIAAVVALWTLPAEVGYRHAASRLGPVTLTGLRGTIWDGRADAISVFGHDLGEINWHARKSPLLFGRLLADVRIKGADVDVAGVVSRGFGGDLEGQDIRFSLPAARLAPAFGAGTVQLLGTISGVVDQATLAQAMLRGASGSARWSDAAADTAASGLVRLPDILAEFASQPDGSIAGRVHDDEKGDLAIDGSFSLHLGSIDATATLRARNDNAQLAESLRHIGEPQPDGSSELVISENKLRLP